MKKKFIKIGFITLMAIVIVSLSFKIFVIEKRRAEITQQILLIEKQEEQKRRLIQRQVEQYETYKRQQEKLKGAAGMMELPPPPAPPPPAIIQISPTDGLRIELDQTTSWNTILQLIFTLLASYLGIRLINKHVRD